MSNAYAPIPGTKLNAEQIKSIVDRVVPLIAEPKDHEFFRGVLTIKAEEQTSSGFAAFVAKLLKTAGGQ